MTSSRLHPALALGAVQDEEKQIIVVLKEHQAGIAVANLCRKRGISDATFYNCRIANAG